MSAKLLFIDENYGDRLSSIRLTGAFEGCLILANAARRAKQTTSTKPWQIQLKTLLESQLPREKVALVGVGHPLKGDDYVGSRAVKAVKKSLNGMLPTGVCLLDAEEHVEEAVTKLASLKPRHIIFIDACEMSAKPGEVRLLSLAKTSYPLFATHGIPLKLLAEQLLSSSEAWILAIQPDRTGFAETLSPEVQKTMMTISDFISASILEVA